jgi:hypothetical protein
MKSGNRTLIAEGNPGPGFSKKIPVRLKCRTRTAVSANRQYWRFAIEFLNETGKPVPFIAVLLLLKGSKIGSAWLCEYPVEKNFSRQEQARNY